MKGNNMILAFNFKNNVVNFEQYSKNLPESMSNLIFFPSFLQIDEFQKAGFVVGSQNVSSCLETLTGSINASMLNFKNVEYAIVGHNEQRTILHETIFDIEAKIKLLFEHNITPILCVGEKENENYVEILKRDLTSFILQNSNKIILAYEPIFAIGSQQPCNKKHIQDVANFINQNYAFKNVLYGGSVNESNIQNFCEIQHIDGFLIGKCSLDCKKVAQIIKMFKI